MCGRGQLRCWLVTAPSRSGLPASVSVQSGSNPDRRENRRLPDPNITAGCTLDCAGQSGIELGDQLTMFLIA